MNDNNIQNVPFIVYESSQASSERVIKRLVVALIVTIILMFLSNAIWLLAWMQYDYVYEGESIDVDATDGIANYIGNDGDINNGTNKSEESKSDSKEETRQTEGFEK